MLQRILVIISLAGLIAFLGVVVGFVAEPDLIVVTCMIIALAVNDFWISVLKPGAAPVAEDLPLEALPSGVSGKPLPPKETPKKKAARRKSTAKRKTAARSRKS